MHLSSHAWEMHLCRRVGHRTGMSTAPPTSHPAAHPTAHPTAHPAAHPTAHPAAALLSPSHSSTPTKPAPSSATIGGHCRCCTTNPRRPRTSVTLATARSRASPPMCSPMARPRRLRTASSCPAAGSTPCATTPLHATPRHTTPLHSTPRHVTPLHSTLLHSPPPARRPTSLVVRAWYVGQLMYDEQLLASAGLADGHFTRRLV
jgi:hypothetical protein